MSPELSRSCDITSPRAHLAARLAALSMLGLTALGVAWIFVTGFRVVTDAWIAPLQLSPDNDKVIALRLGLNRHESELARVEAEIERTDAEVEAIDAAIERLSTLRDNPRASMSWRAEMNGDQHEGLDRIVASLREQQRLLAKLYQRQAALTDAARSDLAAGLIDRVALEQQEQALDRLALQRAQNRRDLEEATLRLSQTEAAGDAYRAGLGASRAGDAAMPEVTAGEEHATRLEIELIRLEGERRSLIATRRVAAERLAEERALMAEVQSRPLYRAVETSTDIAFVPYDQAEDLAANARVMACTWSLFMCRDVGRVAELLPGEVVAEDPWGDLARGHYIILDLDETDAIRETVLRVRR